MTKEQRESLEDYNGMDLDKLKHIPEISFYNHNYYVGKKRLNYPTNDLIFAKSDDDNFTEYYVVTTNGQHIYFGYSETSEDDVIRTDLDF